jgi:hypothetical protein
MLKYKNVTILGSDYKRGMDWILDVLTTCTHHSELQVITALSLIFTLYKSPQHPLSPFPTCCVFNSRSLATASNSGDSSAFRAHVVARRLTLDIWNPLNCQPSTSRIALIVFLNTTLRRPNRKHRFQQYCIVVCVFTDTLPRKELHNSFVLCCVRVCCGRYVATAAVYRVTA